MRDFQVGQRYQYLIHGRSENEVEILSTGPEFIGWRYKDGPLNICHKNGLLLSIGWKLIKPKIKVKVWSCKNYERYFCTRADSNPRLDPKVWIVVGEIEVENICESL